MIEQIKKDVAGWAKQLENLEVEFNKQLMTLPEHQARYMMQMMDFAKKGKTEEVKAMIKGLHNLKKNN